MMIEPLQVCGPCVYEEENACYYGGVESLFSRKLFNQFDYILVGESQQVLRKIHSIFVCKRSGNICMEVQKFENTSRTETPLSTVVEVSQSLELEEIDTSKTRIDRANAMFVDVNAVHGEIATYVNKHIHSYEEYEYEDTFNDELKTRRHQEEYEKDSFIASSDEEDLEDEEEQHEEEEDEYEEEEDEYEEEEDEYEEEEEQHEDEDSVEISRERPTKRRRTRFMPVYYFYRYLKKDKTAVDPRLADLVIAYACDPRDTSSATYKELLDYVTKHYFVDGIDESNAKYSALKKFIEECITKNSVDVYKCIDLIRN